MLTYKNFMDFKYVHKEMVDDMLNEYEHELSRDSMWNAPTYWVELTLLQLLREYQDRLPVLDYYFHKAFRQVDITDSGLIDSVIWKLLNAVTIFWEVFEKFEVGRDEKFQILVEEKSDE